VREHFLSEAPLLKYQLVSLHHEPNYQDSPLLSRFLRLDERIANYLLGSDHPDKSIIDFILLLEPKATFNELCLPLDIQSFLKHG